jgi:cell division protein FtsL
MRRQPARPLGADARGDPHRRSTHSDSGGAIVSWRATVFWSLLAALVGFGLFHVKYQVQKLEDRLAKINRDLVHEQDQIHVLRAEWTYLDRPERIEQLAKKYLELGPPKATQMGSIAQIPMRDAEPVDPASLQSSAQPEPAARRQPKPAIPVIVPTPVATIDRSGPLPGGGR